MRTWPAIDVEHAAPAQGDLVQALFLDHDLAAVEEFSPSASR